MPPINSSWEMSYIVVVTTHCYVDSYLTKKQNESSMTLTAALVAIMHMEWPPPKKSFPPTEKWATPDVVGGCTLAGSAPIPPICMAIWLCINFCASSVAAIAQQG